MSLPGKKMRSIILKNDSVGKPCFSADGKERVKLSIRKTAFPVFVKKEKEAHLLLLNVFV